MRQTVINRWMVLAWISPARGNQKTVKEMAQELSVSESTVRRYVKDAQKFSDLLDQGIGGKEDDDGRTN